MPAPTNINAATAVNIGTSFPYSITQNVNDSGTTYTVWYKVVLTEDSVLSIYGFGDLVDYSVLTTIYTSNGTSVWQGMDYTENLALQVPFLAGTYYFKFESAGGNILVALLHLRVDTGPLDTISGGDLLINQDSDTGPLVTINKLTGAVKNVYPAFFASGESGGSLPTALGYVFHDFASNEVVIYDINLVEISRNSSATYGDIVCSNSTLDKHYSFKTGASFYSLFQWAPVTGLPTTIENNNVPRQASYNPTSFCVNNDLTILYFVGNFAGVSKAVKAWDIVGNAYLTDLNAAESGKAAWDIVMLADDTILVLYYDPGGSTGFVKQFDSAGVLLNTFNFTNIDLPFGTPPRICVGPDDPDSFWIMYSMLDNDGQTQFFRIKISDSSTITDITAPQYETNVYNKGIEDPPDAYFGPAFSCPIVLAVSDTPGATITVTKTVVDGEGGETFDFTATGGLSPGSFSLGDGDSQVFTDVPPGTYSIQETPDTGFTTIYVVTDDQDPAAIEVIADESITIAVTNTAIGPSAALSGIYKIVPNSRKTNDTVYTSLDPVETEDQEIPDPFFKTGLVGQ